MPNGSVDQAVLNKAFYNWPYFGDFKYSGFALLNKITDDDTVIDIGCGCNPFKGKIKNLIGLDPANDAADVKVAIQDYETDQKFSVAFCLGSLTHCVAEEFEERLAKVVSLMLPKSKIFFRVHPMVGNGMSTLPAQFTDLPLYRWSPEVMRRHAAKYGYTVIDMQDEFHPEAGVKRTYIEWAR